jgi:hypothetical protein
MTMRTLAVGAALLALVALPAQAQMGGGGGRHKGGANEDAAKADQQKKKSQAEDKAYHEALKRIPDSKEKYDPWSGTRPAADPKQGK